MKSNSGGRRLGVGFSLAVCVVLPLAGQQQELAPNAPEFTLKTSVNRVLVDVVVRDTHGNPVHGLTKSDFMVAEDGVPQKVLAFDAHDFDNMSYVPPKMPALPADSFVNLPATPERGPLYVLFYDMVNIPQADQPTARAQLVKFIENKPAGARFAILVSSDGVHVIQGFTADKQKLLAAVDPKSERRHVPWIFLMGPNFGEGDRLAATARLSSIARYLAPMPGRKNLIWFASEFPLSLIPNGDETESYRAKIKKTLDLLADNQIAVYPVDVSGVVVYEAYAPPGNVDNNGHGVQTKPPPSSASAATNHGVSLLQLSYWTQDKIAKMTGGEAIYSSNDLTGALKKVTEDGGSYYTLAYSPSNKNFDGQLRHIEVKLKEVKYHLAYRRVYFGLPEKDRDASVDSPIEAAMEHGAPEEHQLIFGVRVTAGSPQPGTREEMASLEKARGAKRPLKRVRFRIYTITYHVMAQQLGEMVPKLEIAAAFFDGDGRLLDSTVNKAVEAEASEQASKSYRMEIALAAPVNAKSLRVAVRDARTGRMGAMEIGLPLR